MGEVVRVVHLLMLKLFNVVLDISYRYNFALFNIIRGSYFTILPILVHDQCYSMVEIRWQGLLLCLHNFSSLSFKVSTQHFSSLIFDMLEILLIPSLGFFIVVYYLS